MAGIKVKIDQKFVVETNDETHEFSEEEARFLRNELLRLLPVHRAADDDDTLNVSSMPWFSLALCGRKIDAIKKLREISGMFLKDAKDTVENFLKEVEPVVEDIRTPGARTFSIFYATVDDSSGAPPF